MLNDNAQIFVNDKFKNFLKLFNIKQVASAPMHSESRGKVERSIGHFRQFSRIFRIEVPELRPELSWIFATKFKNVNKIKGLPVSASFLNSYASNNYIYKGDYKSSILDDVGTKLALGTEEGAEQERISATELYNKAMTIKTRLHKERMKRLNKNKFNHKFEIGDIVAIKNFDRKQKDRELYMYDPNIILEVRRKLLIVESLITGVIRKRHVAHAKKMGTVDGLNIPIEILTKNKFYGKEMLEIMKEGYMKDKSEPSKRVTRNNAAQLDDDSDLNIRPDSDSDLKEVEFELG